MNSKNIFHVRVLTAADLHQIPFLYYSLDVAVEKHRPDLVAIVGDALDAMNYSAHRQFTTAECASHLALLSVPRLIFVRGNHEDDKWSEFVAAWPHKKRELVGIYGSAFKAGPLVVIGFPCMTGSEFSWCAHLQATSNKMELSPPRSREPLPSDSDAWLPALMRRVGPAGRTLWLMHESPIGLPLAHPNSVNPDYTTAVERFSPRFVLCGHDHTAPLKNNIWNARLGNSLCANAGQSISVFHYTVIDFEFPKSSPCLPSKITVRAFPWGKEVVV